MFHLRPRLIVIFTLLAAITLSTSPSFGRGGRGGGGRGAGAGAGEGRGAGRGGENGGQRANNLGRGGNGLRDFDEALGFEGGLQQAGNFDQPGTFNNRSPGSQVLLNPYQQQVSQFQQRAMNPTNGQRLQGTLDGTQRFQNGDKAFLNADGIHPQAWQYTHPHADAAVVATAASVAAWMVPEDYLATDSETNYEDTSTIPTGSDEFVDQDSANVSSDPSQWMPLGNYSLEANPGMPSTVSLQLAVDRTGNLGGIYYDSLTNTSHNVAGILDRTTQVAQWYLANNPQVTFQTPLSELLKSTGTVQVNLATGPRQWQMVRTNGEKNNDVN